MAHFAIELPKCTFPLKIVWVILMALILTTFYLIILENVALKNTTCSRGFFGYTRGYMEHFGELNLFQNYILVNIK